MNTSCFSFKISPTNPDCPLGVETWIGNELVADYQELTQSKDIVCNFNDDDGQLHIIKIIIKNKKLSYTQVNDAGEIISDSLVEINNFNLDDINIDKVIQQKAVYTHNFNGSGPETNDRFFGSAGCNGTITVEFTTPVYLWLLENL